MVIRLQLTFEYTNSFFKPLIFILEADSFHYIQTMQSLYNNLYMFLYHIIQCCTRYLYFFKRKVAYFIMPSRFKRVLSPLYLVYTLLLTFLYVFQFPPLGAVHKRRRKFFPIFLPLPPHVGSFNIVISADFVQFLTPPPLEIADVLNV